MSSFFLKALNWGSHVGRIYPWKGSNCLCKFKLPFKIYTISGLSLNSFFDAGAPSRAHHNTSKCKLPLQSLIFVINCHHLQRTNRIFRLTKCFKISYSLYMLSKWLLCSSSLKNIVKLISLFLSLTASFSRLISFITFSGRRGCPLATSSWKSPRICYTKYFPISLFQFSVT